jgi:hypothetical protein
MIHQTDSEPPQPVAEAESLVGVASTDLFSVFDACLDRRPHLLLEIGYNRVVDWMVHIYDGTGLGIKNAELIISTQSPDREEAMSEAIEQLRGRFMPELITGSGTENGVSPNIVLVEISSENDQGRATSGAEKRP